MIRNGWNLYKYALFANDFDRMEERVAKLKRTDPSGYDEAAISKLAASIRHLVLERIPTDPSASEFRQGNTLGKEYKQWFRAKFHGRYRLFFRYSTEHRAIVYVWMSSDKTLRKAGAKSDPYALFATMLKSGHPPSDFDELLQRSSKL